MNLKTIDWNHVTRYSQLIAVILFVAVFALGFWLGKTYEFRSFVNAERDMGTAANQMVAAKPIADVTYTCDAAKTVRAIYRTQEVELLLSDGRHFKLPQAISGSGARYANADESTVFWNKGNTAFITENSGANQHTTFANCTQKPIPE